jgi:replicative DNA helicase
MNASDSSRVPPNDQNAERAVLGGMLLENAAIDVVADVPLTREDFYRDAHALIFEAICNVAQSGEPVDTTTLRDELIKTGSLPRVGGDEYLLALTDTIPTVSNIEAHARIVREKAVVRRIIHACYETAAKGYGDYGPIEDFVNEAESALSSAGEWKSSKSTTSTLGEVVERYYEQLVVRAESGRNLLGHASGLHDLDQILCGFVPGRVYYVVARPGLGKTSLAQQITLGIAGSSKETVAVLSLEMPEEEVGGRMLSSEASVDGRRIRALRLNRDDWQALTHAAGVLGTPPVRFFRQREMGVLDLRRACRRLKREQGLAMVVIDYLQLMSSGMRTDNREQDVAAISRNLKLMAVELQISVVALAQLNRGPETRSDKRPQLSDIRESGAAEQDADAVIAIYRDEVYNPKTEERGVAELIVLKQRHGPCGTVRVGWQGEFTRFVNLERQQGGDGNHWSDR